MLSTLRPALGGVSGVGLGHRGFPAGHGAADALRIRDRDGHTHQVLQKVEGNVTFHTAMSTAFPQPAPGVGAGPGPMKIPEALARPMPGTREVRYVVGSSPLALVDSTLG